MPPINVVEHEIFLYFSLLLFKKHQTHGKIVYLIFIYKSIV